MKRLGLILCLLAGCAHSLPVRTVESLRRSGVAAGFFCPNKQIHYDEQIYRVVYYEERSLDVRYDGIWDIDSELGKLLTVQLKRKGLRAHYLGEFLTSLQLSMEHVGDVMCNSTPEEFPNKSASLAPLWTALTEAGVGYLTFSCGSPYSVYSTADTASVHMGAVLLFYDVASRSRIYARGMHLQPRISYRDSIREMEQNGLLRLRRATSNSFASSARTVLAEMLGEEPAKPVGFVVK